jgi:hypothetical protein
MIQLKDLEHAKECASIALEHMQNLVVDLNRYYKLPDILKLDAESIQKATNFAEKAKINYIFRSGFKLSWFFNEV